MTPKVSITVPIYNAEKYLSRCLDSLTKQTLSDIEIILVDDGSTDSSGKICDEYAQNDCRIKVFHKENGGSGAARQLGLENSTGEYYTVCDSDDWVESNMYEVLYNKAKKENSDIVLSCHYINYPDGKQIESPTYRFVSQDVYILDIMYHKASVNTWSKLFRMSTIRKYDITYESGINLGEDALFLYKILLNPVKIISVNNSYYHYQRNMNSQSYTNNLSIVTLQQSEYVTNWIIQNYSDSKYRKYHVRSQLGLSFLALRVKNIDDIYFNRFLKYVKIKNLYLYDLFSLKTYLMLGTRFLGKHFGLYVYSKMYKYFYK